MTLRRRTLLAALLAPVLAPVGKLLGREQPWYASRICTDEEMEAWHKAAEASRCSNCDHLTFAEVIQCPYSGSVTITIEDRTQ